MSRYVYIILFGALVFCQSCKIAAPLVTDVKSFNFKNTETGKTGVEVEFKIKNPNGFALKIKRFDFEVTVNNKVLGKAYASKKIKIARQSEMYYPILLESDISEVSTLLSGFGTLLQGKTEVMMKGSVKCGAGFLSKKFKVEAKAKINLKDFF